MMLMMASMFLLVDLSEIETVRKKLDGMLRAM